MLGLQAVEQALGRIEPYITNTPIFSSRLLNQWMGHRFHFKFEGLQRLGSFKARGALNTLLVLKEKGRLPKQVVAYSSGNHAQGVAWACREVGVPAIICMPAHVSKVKLAGCRAYGAEARLFPGRIAAETAAAKLSQGGAFLIPPFDHDDVIAGQGTSVLEAFNSGLKPDLVITPVGGGGCLSGAFIASKGQNWPIDVVGAEPALANDAVMSRAKGSIVRLKESPNTLADGARPLAVSERTFEYLKQVDGLYEVTEQQICYWTQWLSHLLKLHLEPTSAMTMQAAAFHLKTAQKTKDVLLILSGGNVDAQTMVKIWEQNHLENPPSM